MGADYECVPHHIHETYPSPTALGKATYSPHMKTNNEPANPNDDQPATVEQVLGQLGGTHGNGHAPLFAVLS